MSMDNKQTSRITRRFETLKQQKRGGLVTFFTAGDPDYTTSLHLLKGLPAAGADLIELGMPFTDPMADGPAIQLAGQRALKNGQTLEKTLEMVADFRSQESDTPVILMGYYNPIYIYGVENFLNRAKQAGVDGLIIVDLPPEEDEELCLPALKKGIHFIRLITPTTDDARIATVLANSSGFVYYVSITGITGTQSASERAVEQAITRLRHHTDLPIAVGFGVKTADNVADVTRHADAAVVGSAFINKISANLNDHGQANENLVPSVLTYVKELATGTKNNA